MCLSSPKQTNKWMDEQTNKQAIKYTSKLQTTKHKNKKKLALVKF